MPGRHRYNSGGVTHGQPLRWSFSVAAFLVMKTDNLEKQVKLLSILVDGCKKHPAYRAIRPATGRCKPCVDMWQARQDMTRTVKIMSGAKLPDG